MVLPDVVSDISLDISEIYSDCNEQSNMFEQSNQLEKDY